MPLYLLYSPASIIGSKNVRHSLYNSKHAGLPRLEPSSGPSVASRTSNAHPHAIHLFFRYAECLDPASCSTLLAIMLFLGTPWWMPCFQRPNVSSMPGMRPEMLGLCIPARNQVRIRSENISREDHISTVSGSSINLHLQYLHHIASAGNRTKASIV
jgi:hypothetical protein